jgi:osmotically inducible protein OsmC
MAITRTSEARWEGDLKNGNGRIKLGSGTFEGQYGFKSRFESGPGTNPEELIAAAHAGCFTMALSGQLTAANLPPESLETTASVKLEKVEGGFGITAIHLVTKAKVPGADKAAFDTAAANAKAGCPISKLFKGNAEITLDATLV